MDWVEAVTRGGAVVAIMILIGVFLKFLKLMIDRFLLQQNEERDRAERIFEKQSDTVQNLGESFSDALRRHDERNTEQHAAITQNIITQAGKNGDRKNG